MESTREITACRVCGNTHLSSVLDLGMQALTGVFPKQRTERVPHAPLHLVRCADAPGSCGLVQLKHSFDPGAMYGSNYGYRSGLNASMVSHLRAKASGIHSCISLQPDDLVVDIGSNDSTFLRAMDAPGVDLVGIDPTGAKFRQYYPPHVHLIPDFFSGERFRREFGSRKARVVTSIAMFYDLEDPIQFMRDIAGILADDGIWVLEQSYLPTMLNMNSYDTVCHEHLEYYGLKQIKYMADRAGLKVIDVELNNVNGGSFSITAALSSSHFKVNEARITELLATEESLTPEAFAAFRTRVYDSRSLLLDLLAQSEKQGKKLFGYGASTKGNVLLQFCDLGPEQLPYIAEVNPDKFGAFTPKTLIPIISEEDAAALRPDGYLVLPWHFREHILRREAKYLDAGGQIIFPLPTLETVKAVPAFR